VSVDHLTPEARVQIQDHLMLRWLQQHTPHVPERRHPRKVRGYSRTWPTSVWPVNDSQRAYVRRMEAMDRDAGLRNQPADTMPADCRATEG
jgi:hypothetical protein